ncbi:MAG TPA: WbuC family cupin fold metalloprotein [Chloroflexia bacterium]|nr:WbuC family cupin fold metalloprotein [Chloroflexia bacterium]
MSTLYSRDENDPLSLVPFGEELLDRVTEMAKGSPRKRNIIRFHEHGEGLQRMLNAIEPESYARPHKHTTKPEAFVVLRGSLLVARFAEDGTPLEGVVLSADGPVRGVEIPPGAWHSIVSLESGTVMFETIQGPYDPATHKVFAEWSPPEDGEAGPGYIAWLRGQFEQVMPEVAARDLIAAEEDDIC